MSEEVAEAHSILELLRHEFEDLAVGGLRVAGPERLTVLRHLESELDGLGLNHLSDRVGALATDIENDHPGSAEKLMLAQASIRSFERLLTLDYAGSTLHSFQERAEEGGEE